MNRHGEKEQLTSVPSCVESHFQNAPYKDYKLLLWLVLIPNSPPAVMMVTCWLLNEVGVNMLLTL